MFTEIVACLDADASFYHLKLLLLVVVVVVVVLLLLLLE